jgi:isopropylmalate/homocitrate/citramalate synthase
MDFGLGVANTVQAVAQGVDTVQVSVTGIGERSGNVPLEDTVLALNLLYGIETGIDYSKLYRLSKLVRELAGVPYRRTAALSATRSSTSSRGSSRLG